MQIDRAQRTYRIVVDGLRVDDVNASGAKVIEAVMKVDDGVGGLGIDRQGHGVNCEIPSAQVILQRLIAISGDVDGKSIARHHDPADIALVVEDIGRQTEDVCQAEGQRNGVNGDNEIDVMDGASQQGIANRAADEMDGHCLGRQQRADALQYRRLSKLCFSHAMPKGRTLLTEQVGKHFRLEDGDKRQVSI